MSWPPPGAVDTEPRGVRLIRLAVRIGLLVVAAVAAYLAFTLLDRPAAAADRGPARAPAVEIGTAGGGPGRHAGAVPGTGVVMAAAGRAPVAAAGHRHAGGAPAAGRASGRTVNHGATRGAGPAQRVADHGTARRAVDQARRAVDQARRAVDQARRAVDQGGARRVGSADRPAGVPRRLLAAVIAGPPPPPSAASLVVGVTGVVGHVSGGLGLPAAGCASSAPDSPLAPLIRSWPGSNPPRAHEPPVAPARNLPASARLPALGPVAGASGPPAGTGAGGSARAAAAPASPAPRPPLDTPGPIQPGLACVQAGQVPGGAGTARALPTGSGWHRLQPGILIRLPADEVGTGRSPGVSARPG